LKHIYDGGGVDDIGFVDSVMFWFIARKRLDWWIYGASEICALFAFGLGVFSFSVFMLQKGGWLVVWGWGSYNLGAFELEFLACYAFLQKW